MAVVGGLAAFGTFNSIMNFPLVFGGICLALGWFDLWRNRATVRAAPWALLLLVGAALPVTGWLLLFCTGCGMADGAPFLE